MRCEDLNIDKIYINTVAKVGSASFLHSLRGAGFDVHHGHSLAFLRSILAEQQNNLIISGIRNPLDRNLSYYFQTYADDFHNDVKIRNNNYQGEYCFVMEKDKINEISPLQIIDSFHNQNWHYTFNDWFYEFFEISKIEFLDFNKDLGIGLYSLPNNNYLLFYVFEKLKISTPFLEAFFGIKELEHSNNSDERIYKNQYNRVKALIKIPQKHKESLLLTPIMNNFYKKDDIASFLEKY